MYPPFTNSCVSISITGPVQLSSALIPNKLFPSVANADCPHPDSNIACANVIDGNTPYSLKVSCAIGATASINACPLSEGTTGPEGPDDVVVLPIAINIDIIRNIGIKKEAIKTPMLIFFILFFFLFCFFSFRRSIKCIYYFFENRIELY